MIVPSSRPKATREIVIAAAKKQWVKQFPDQFLPDSFVFGCRGYYLNTMGETGKNDRGIYDDAIALVGLTSFAIFNANTDPSAFKKDVASLLSGCYPYKMGMHGQSHPDGGYPAFRPATPDEELPVKRDGDSCVPSKTPGVAINIHRGGYRGTSSLGCQTLHPTQWDAFYSLTKHEMVQNNLKTIWYILTDGPIT